MPPAFLCPVRARKRHKPMLFLLIPSGNDGFSALRGAIIPLDPSPSGVRNERRLAPAFLRRAGPARRFASHRGPHAQSAGALQLIAAVNGTATAAGCQLVAQCDLAVACSEARFAVSGVNLGFFCSTPAVPLSRNIARKHAAEMLFTGEFIDAPTALAWGLVNRVAPHADLMNAVDALADKLLAKPREVLALGKALFYRQLEERMDAAYRDASCTISENMARDVAKEGVRAFLEKRKPQWND